jgi:hypothetical protein
MAYVVEMDSGAVIYTYMPNLIKISSGIRGTHREHGARLSLLLLFHNEEVG